VLLDALGEWVRMEDAAEAAGTTPSVMRRRIAEGVVVAKRLGTAPSVIWVNLESLERYVQGLLMGPGGEDGPDALIPDAYSEGRYKSGAWHQYVELGRKTKQAAFDAGWRAARNYSRGEDIFDSDAAWRRITALEGAQ
jgi:hypothetical protein